MQYRPNSTWLELIAMHRNAENKYINRQITLRHTEKEQMQLMAFGLLMSQQFTTPVVFLVTGVALMVHQEFQDRRAYVSHIHIYRRKFSHNMDMEGFSLIGAVCNAGSSDPCCCSSSHTEARCRETSFLLNYGSSGAASGHRHPHWNTHTCCT